MRPSIFNYDLKYASKVIWGDANILQMIPDISASSLPIEEVETLFFTRLWAFLGCLDESGLSVDRTGDNARFFRNQMAKAVLAVIDTLLSRKKAYHSGYRERVARFAKHYPEKGRSAFSLSEWALEEKLKPKGVAMSQSAITALYGDVHKHFFSEMYCAWQFISDTKSVDLRTSNSA